MEFELFDTLAFFKNFLEDPEIANSTDTQKIISHLKAVHETFVETSLFNIFIYDSALRANVWVNKGYLDQGRFTEEEVVGRGEAFLDSILHPEDLTLIHKAFATETPEDGIFRTHCRKLNRDGQWDWLYLMAMHLPEANGNPNLFLGFSVNLSKDGFVVDHWSDISQENARLRNQLIICSLTNREIEIIKLFATELSQKEIGHKLNISFYTVETHKRNIFKKLSKNSIAGIVAFAVEAGLS